jgi:hypothetical protein
MTAKLRVADHKPFYSSHRLCYMAGLHANSTTGRESCRTGQHMPDVVPSTRRAAAALTEPETPAPSNVKSRSPKIKTVHAANESGSPLCGTQLTHSGVDNTLFTSSPVTCKSCLKRVS